MAHTLSPRSTLPTHTFSPQIPSLRAIVEDLVACRYASALRSLRALRPALLSDPFAATQSDLVFGLVRRRCIAQYLQPYSAVDLSAMAQVFDSR